MVGAVSIVGSSLLDSKTCQCLCFDSCGDLNLQRGSIVPRLGSFDLSSSFLDYSSKKALLSFKNLRKQRKNTSLVVVDELAGHYIASNEHGYGKRFLRNLHKDKHELAERVMVTRLHLYGKWIKRCDHTEMYERISDQNLELMRERLMETVVWPSDDTGSELD
ncbi:hypothetical protein RD792_009573 [Penstemon davidsonii]|uniref:Uncharacterized protein n=1 Tax=Penstemon davidsonii TaxID=160366 RepID=A0ABR0CZG0_9LAMI|nr:hypothetical protein RD792_009573 [Penstemon davidsonii]